MKLNQLWHKYNYKISNTTNLIISPVGSGKTTWIFKTAIKEYNINKILYLCDTTNLKDSVVADEEYNHLCKYYDSKDLGNITKNCDFGINIFNDNKLTVMTYSFAGTLLKYNPYAFNNLDCIIVDEAHQLYKYKDKFDSEDNTPYQNVIELLQYQRIHNRTIIMLTATPEKIQNKISRDIGDLTVYDFRNDKNIDKLNDKEIKLYNHKSELEEVLHEFNILNKHRLNKLTIFADKISTCNKLVNMCYKEGLNAVAIWSLNNSNYDMSTQQIRARESVINYGKIPDDIDVLIFNASLETGINIHDNRVVWHISHTTNETSQIQSRGRNRRDLLCHYKKTKEKLNKSNKMMLDDKWLNRPLTKEDKEILVNELNIVNENGRLKKWTSISKDLKEMGYIITNPKITIDGKRKSVHIITKQ